MINTPPTAIPRLCIYINCFLVRVFASIFLYITVVLLCGFFSVVFLIGTCERMQMSEIICVRCELGRRARRRQYYNRKGSMSLQPIPFHHLLIVLLVLLVMLLLSLLLLCVVLRTLFIAWWRTVLAVAARPDRSIAPTGL